MKRLSSFAIRISLMVLIGTLVWACQKDEKGKDQVSYTESAENNAFAEQQYTDAQTMVDQVGLGNTVYYSAGGTRPSDGIGPLGVLGNPCATAMLDTTVSPNLITIDFGSSNCLCLDGRNRRGKVLASFTGHYRDSGTVIQISFDNYFVNDYQVAGTKTITNLGTNGSGHPIFSVVVAGQVVKPNNGGTTTWNSTRTREWKAGYNSLLNILDDVYAITGTANGTNAGGSSYSIAINQELVRKMNCFWFESGKMTLTQEGLPDITLDYGNTGCDANAVITVLGTDIPVILK